MKKIAAFFTIILMLTLLVCEENSVTSLSPGYIQGIVTIDGQGVDNVIIDINSFDIGGELAKNSLFVDYTASGEYNYELDAGNYSVEYTYTNDAEGTLRAVRYPIVIAEGETTIVNVEFKDPIPHCVMASDTNASVLITWESAYEVVGYKVYRADSTETDFDMVGEVDSASGTLSYNDYPPAIGDYNYYVKSVDASNIESGYDGIVEIAFTGDIDAPTGILAVDEVEYVHLSWQANSRASIYKVYRSESNTQNWQFIHSVSISEYDDVPSDTGVYYYYITAVSSYGIESEASVYTSVDFDGRFDPPQGLTIADQGSSLYLSWQGFDNAAYYTIYRGYLTDQTFSERDTTINPYYADSPADTGHYFYYITATSTNGQESDPSDTVSSYYDGVLDYPANFAGTDRGLYVELTWDEVPYAEAFRLYRSVNNAVYDQIASVGGSVLLYNDTPNYAGTFYYKIASEAEDGSRGELSDPISVEFTDDLLAPEEITAVSSGTFVMVAWSRAAGATGYKIYRAYDETGSYEYIDSTQDSTFNDIPPIADYFYYKVRAYDNLGHLSQFSASASVYFEDIPLAPYDIVAVDSLYKVDLWWESYETSADYMIYRSITMDSDYEYINTVYDVLEASDYPSAGGYYFYKLRTIANNDTSDLSDYVYISFSGILDEPQDLNGYDAGTHVHLTWSEPVGADHYGIYRSDTYDGDYNLMITVYENSANDVPSEAGVYYYKIKAYTEGDLESSFSDVVQIDFTP